jgi:DNA-binding CsgD family transcriptional regulator
LADPRLPEPRCLITPARRSYPRSSHSQHKPQAAKPPGISLSVTHHKIRGRTEARLSARERDLVTLVAQGRTDAQIAAQLYISIRTVRSHLDRIRDKTGGRRRADLTRLALTEGLV